MGARWRTSVLLPVCRAPVTTTTGALPLAYLGKELVELPKVFAEQRQNRDRARAQVIQAGAIQIDGVGVTEEVSKTEKTLQKGACLGPQDSRPNLIDGEGHGVQQRLMPVGTFGKAVVDDSGDARQRGFDGAVGMVECHGGFGERGPIGNCKLGQRGEYFHPAREHPQVAGDLGTQPL